jgi:hypothetical protein
MPVPTLRLERLSSVTHSPALERGHKGVLLRTPAHRPADTGRPLPVPTLRHVRAMSRRTLPVPTLRLEQLKRRPPPVSPDLPRFAYEYRDVLLRTLTHRNADAGRPLPEPRYLLSG